MASQREDLEAALRGCVLFQECSHDELAGIVTLLAERTIATGAVIVAEGEPATELFVIRSGQVEVTKRADAVREHRLTTLGAGASFGELTLVDRGPRSASVRALEPTTVAVLSMRALDRATADDAGTRVRMLGGLASHLAHRLRGVSEVTATALQEQLELAEMRVRMGTFLTYVLLMMVGYGFAMRIAADLAKTVADTTVVTVPILLGFAVPMYVMMRRSGEPIATYGLTWRGAGPAFRDGLLWSIPLLAVTLVLKVALVRTVPALRDAPVFALGGLRDPTVAAAAVWLALVSNLLYVALVPIQEFIARGAMQTSLARFLVGPRSTMMAIVLANAMFMASHLYLSTSFALLAMVPGLLWGWLYARHGTLIAPIVSHALLGWWSFFVLGFDRLLV
jgi:CRP-like cAMP-binding protein